MITLQKRKVKVGKEITCKSPKKSRERNSWPLQKSWPDGPDAIKTMDLFDQGGRIRETFVPGSAGSLFSDYVKGLLRSEQREVNKGELSPKDETSDRKTAMT